MKLGKDRGGSVVVIGSFGNYAVEPKYSVFALLTPQLFLMIEKLLNGSSMPSLQLLFTLEAKSGSHI